MIKFIQNQIDNEKEFKSVYILLKAEWSELKNHIELNWLTMQGKPKKFMKGAQQTEEDRWDSQGKIIYIMKNCTENFQLH